MKFIHRNFTKFNNFNNNYFTKISSDDMFWSRMPPEAFILVDGNIYCSWRELPKVPWLLASELCFCRSKRKYLRNPNVPSYLRLAACKEFSLMNEKHRAKTLLYV